MAERWIETERLLLRGPQDSDLAWQLEFLNTAAVMRFLGGERSANQVAQSFALNAAAWEQGEPAFWTALMRQSGELIGRCGLSRIKEEPAPVRIRGAIQIGWSFAEPFWGQGLASEAARAAIDYGFEAYGAPEIWAQTSDSNAASTRLMARLGLVRCPELCYRDEDYPPIDNPTIVYRLGRDDWAAQTRASR